jgi:hypothetical protein
MHQNRASLKPARLFYALKADRYGLRRHGLRRCLTYRGHLRRLRRLGRFHLYLRRPKRQSGNPGAQLPDDLAQAGQFTFDAHQKVPAEDHGETVVRDIAEQGL